MLTILAVVLTILGTWVLEGGRRRRTPTDIKDLIDLAAVVEDESQARELRSRADAKLKTYLKPWWRATGQAATWEKWAAVGSGAMLLALGIVTIPDFRDADAPSAAGLIAVVLAAIGATGALVAFLSAVQASREATAIATQRKAYEATQDTHARRIDDLEHAADGALETYEATKRGDLPEQGSVE